ncbi:MAG: transcriptional regulator, LuxR family [Candidatus Eremiobacteraeota bacterium]|nr:transcriptional regulator, LuxR family [Candidatus Eremiobacteraeota bacterium]
MITAGVYSHQLIGRSRELAFLVERARDVRHRGGAIIVRGEAGIGKTRLVEDFARMAQAAGASVGTGSAREYANAPYAALTEALTSLQIGPIPPPSETGGDAKFAWYASVADELHAAVAVTAHGTVVILEDLHWADVATLDLLRFCASRLAADPVLFVATYRTDDIEADTARARAISALERDAEVIALNPLPPGQIEHLITLILERIGRNVPLDIVAEIRDLADGRPLFAEELLRGVLERLDRDETGRPSVPTSVRATVRERYASLEPDARNVLLHAAVFGRRFSAQSVASLLDSNLGAIYASLRHARDLQLVVEDAQDDDRFAFRHALVREAIYGELLRAEARVVHGRVATLLASSPHADVSEVAEHAWHARDGENAADWNERAGDLASSLYAYAESARTYDRAFRSTADESRRARVAQRAAESVYVMGDVERSAEWFAHAAEANRRLGAAALAGRLRLRRARVLYELGRYDEGLAEADAIAGGEDGVDAAVRIEAETIAAGLLVGRGRAVEALERLRNVDAHDASLDPAVSTRFSATYAYALSLVGRAAEARSRFEHAIAVAQSAGDDDMVLRTYNNWGSMEVGYGTLARARELYTAGLTIADATKNLRQTAWLAQNSALAALLGADLDDATKLLARGEEIGHSLSFVHRWALAVKLRLMTVRGAVDDELLARATAAFDEARRDTEHGVDTSALHILGAALAFHFAAVHATDEAERYAVAASRGIAGVEAPYWLIDAAARFGDRGTRERARQRIAELAAPQEAGPARGFLAIVDAREALRRRNRDEARAMAELAVDAFRTAGWRLEEGFALETAGRAADAVALFRSVGAHGEVRRLTETAATQRRRGDETLTPREREIARLLAAGQTARSIADALVISERTVETHAAAVYRKLGVANRQELSALVSDATAT